jgi:RNase P/RNase MRP subunit p29
MMPLAVSALTPLSRGYLTDESIPVGSIVSLVDETSDKVVASTNRNADSILGAVINEDSSLLAVSNKQAQQVLVTTSGAAQILVSDINGDIERGDHITASPIKGVGMKATGNTRVVGTAQTSLQNAKEQTYEDENGIEQTMLIGDASVLVNVAYYFKEPDKTIIPSALQNLANALAGRTVETLPIIISGAIFLVMLVVVASLVYSMIKSSIISVGRNPMSQGAIYRDLIQLSALVLVILGVGFSAIYMVLTRV